MIASVATKGGLSPQRSMSSRPTRELFLGETNSRLGLVGNYRSLSKKTFRPFRLRVSVVARNPLNYCALPTDTPVAGVSVMKGLTHRHPAQGVSVVNVHVYCKLCLTTDTSAKKGEHRVLRQFRGSKSFIVSCHCLSLRPAI